MTVTILQNEKQQAKTNPNVFRRRSYPSIQIVHFFFYYQKLFRLEMENNVQLHKHLLTFSVLFLRITTVHQA
jgi:hypothetical protein